MDSKKVEKTYKKICKFVVNMQLTDALNKISKLLENIENIDLKNSFEKQKQIYSMLLEYTFKGFEDPERENIYKKLQIDLLDLADKLRFFLLEKYSSDHLFSEKRIFNKEINRNSLTGIPQLFKEIIEASKDSENEERKRLLNKLFMFIWVSEKFTASDVSSIKKYIRSRKLETYEKSVITSAITLSLLLSFDKEKINTLFDIYDTNEDLVWNRALVGLVIGFYIYDDRANLYSDIIARLELISSDPNIKENIENIILQFIRTKETSTISDKLRDEILPEMMKFQSTMEDKLNLDNILPDSLGEDINPDWEEVFEDAPELLNKMEEFSQLQLDGSDVFMSAFSMLKHFPFFYTPTNWLLPFHKNNSEVIDAFSNEGEMFDVEAFTSGLEKSAYICNSDKYSFCLNIKMMPSAQKKMILDLFKMELNAMNEVNESDELIDAGLKDKHVFVRYIQDIYRFFNLHSWKDEFNNVFDTKLDIHNTNFFKIVINDEKILLKIAEFNFKKNYYDDAREIFLQLDLKGKDARRIYEKIGFSYQKEKQFKKALENYEIASLYEDESLWLTKKMAFCHRKLGNFEKALEFYKKVEENESENLHIQANIGHCLLEIKKHEDALKYYHKVEYYEPENYRVMRPLAWCSFVIGKFENAEKYYQKIIDKAPIAYDYFNYAHIFFCKGDKEKASKLYKRGIRKSSFEKFEQSIDTDTEMLINHGVSEIEIKLLKDFLKLVKV